ncbi:MAG: RluA family pseudouridine synthase [Deltaproteobacteria bacterium]|nr:RluA family pseudouridine synthase [Deltaproteobacteria bacterium]
MQKLTVTPKDDSKRIDLFLKEKLAISRKQAKSLLDAGRVFLKKKKILMAGWQVQTDNVFEIFAPNETIEKKSPSRKRFLKIYYEDADLLVVEKPAGVACERTAQTTSSTLVDDINDYLKRQSGSPHNYLGLMHRLDKGTSGLMVYTKSKRANALSQQFKNHSIERQYLALVHGRMGKAEGRIQVPILKDPTNPRRQITASKNQPGLPSAITDYQVVERYPNATLIEATLQTGRTHQVRVHLASLGHPIIGDRVYGQDDGLNRHALHANFLAFHHPVSKKPMKFNSPLPPDLKALIDQLRSY